MENAALCGCRAYPFMAEVCPAESCAGNENVRQYNRRGEEDQGAGRYILLATAPGLYENAEGVVAAARTFGVWR